MDELHKRTDKRTLIVANSARLISDAKLLADNGRFRSACALSILAVEEIGKLIHDIWHSERPLPGPRGRRLNHRGKQAVVASLLMGKHASDFVRANAMTSDLEELVEPLAKELFESEAGRFRRFVELGAIDKTKELGLYRDEWAAERNLYEKDFTYEDVGDFFDKARATIALVGDTIAMRAGRAIYEVQLSRNP